MTFLIFALSQNGARRNDVFNGFPFSSANPTFINYRLQTAYVFFIISCIYNITNIMKTSSTNNITREVGITGALKFENCNFTA
jgi:hypothetical protein